MPGKASVSGNEAKQGGLRTGGVSIGPEDDAVERELPSLKEPISISRFIPVFSCLSSIEAIQRATHSAVAPGADATVGSVYANGRVRDKKRRLADEIHVFTVHDDERRPTWMEGGDEWHLYFALEARSDLSDFAAGSIYRRSKREKWRGRCRVRREIKWGGESARHERTQCS